MKQTIKSIAIIAIAAFITISFSGILDGKIEIKADKSTLTWKGYKVTGSHTGTLVVKSGSLTFKNDKLTDGEFVIDMASLISTDLEGEYKGKLEGHLKSDDFFGVEKHPTATLLFKKVTATGKNSYSVTGDLTIKGKTNKIDFDLSVYGRKANATLKIDRSKYGVKYGSSSFFEGLKDKVIYDDFDLIADLEF
ncbi:MAG: YceI family protein [Flavobacteriaceae bacterium]